MKPSWAAELGCGNRPLEAGMAPTAEGSAVPGAVRRYAEWRTLEDRTDSSGWQTGGGDYTEGKELQRSIASALKAALQSLLSSERYIGTKDRS
ncbi:hypothetical protein P7K49_030354 [Saguinus oedipus]|uniref:Uncharacterized protein n=1 Tax=Saguinus oedipus TaxID=9490 RepID=A0ABQ9U1X9_SAGOE|nr:hypothetical protein P7K49_030354 [Saguinus oedipus]